MVRKSVVILSPDGGGKEDVEGRDLLPPFDLETLLQPLAMLIDHRVDNVYKGFVTIQKAMAAGENVAFEPSLSKVSLSV